MESVLVTHRRRTLELADHVLLTAGGRVATEGTFRWLLDNSPEMRRTLAYPVLFMGEDTESADARVGDWCGLVARRWVFEEAGAACGSRSMARICAIAGIAVECG